MQEREREKFLARIRIILFCACEGRKRVVREENSGERGSGF